ncbi:MAG: hypothetical protein ACI3XA_01115 [Clostridia bacterium]
MSEIKYLSPNEQKAAMERDKREYMKTCMDEERMRSSNYFLGFWGAFSGALSGAILYGMLRSSGWIGTLFGFVMVIMASKYYDATKVKRNLNKFWCVMISCVIALPIGEFLGSMIYIMSEETIAQHASGYFKYYVNHFGEFMSYSAGNLFLGYVFTLIGGFKVFKDIKDYDKKLEEIEEYLNVYEEDA